MKKLNLDTVYMLRTSKAHLAMLKALASKEGTSMADLIRRRLWFSKKDHACHAPSPAECAYESSTLDSPPSNTQPASDASADSATPLT